MKSFQGASFLILKGIFFLFYPSLHVCEWMRGFIWQGPCVQARGPHLGAALPWGLFSSTFTHSSCCPTLLSFTLFNLILCYKNLVLKLYFYFFNHVGRMLPESKTQNFVKIKDDINLENVKILKERHSLGHTVMPVRNGMYAFDLWFLNMKAALDHTSPLLWSFISRFSASQFSQEYEVEDSRLN